MRITQVRIAHVDGSSNLIGYAVITVDDCFCVRDLKILRRAAGYKIAMPQERLKNGRYKQIVFALDAEARKDDEDAVITDYEKLAGKGSRLS